MLIIVGSGFGGAVTSCRLAEAGASVIVLERGRGWGPNDFPRKPTIRGSSTDDPATRQRLVRRPHVPAHDAWRGRRCRRRLARLREHLRQREDGHLRRGLARRDHRTTSWRRTTRTSGGCMDEQARAAAAVARAHEAAEGRRPRPPDGAAASGRSISPSASTPSGSTICRTRTPAQVEDRDEHPRRSSRARACISATATSGATVKARNTLDFNYLPVAAKAGAEIRPLHLVRASRRSRGGYRVTSIRFERRARRRPR